MNSLVFLVIMYVTLQVLLYHGSLDIICHYTGAQEMLVKANWTGKDEYHQSRREPFWVYNEVTYPI